MKRLFSATLNSLRAFGWGVRREAALREEMIVFLVALPLGYFLAPSPAWYIAMMAALLVVLAVEFLNTAIEKLADHITRERHPDIGVIKDLGSAAVFCALCLAAIVWLAAIGVRCGWL